MGALRHAYGINRFVPWMRGPALRGFPVIRRGEMEPCRRMQELGNQFCQKMYKC